MEKQKSQPAAAILLTDKEAAALLRISTKHFRNLVADGRLPMPVRLGGAVRWKRSSIEEAIAAEASS